MNKTFYPNELCINDNQVENIQEIFFIKDIKERYKENPQIYNLFKDYLMKYNDKIIDIDTLYNNV